MTDNLELYKLWAPSDAEWTSWVKPILFMNLSNNENIPSSPFTTKCISWTEYDKSRLIIVDLPDKESLRMGFSLAKIGYRPIPLYNGIPGGPHQVVPMKEIVSGLHYGKTFFKKTSISPTANPAFLLDSNRLIGNKKKPGTFDNRWCIVPQDVPSADYLKKKKIKQIIVRTNLLRNDLAYILYQYQQQGIDILHCDRNEKVTTMTLGKPKTFPFFYRFLMLLGFVRNDAGGFGMSIPEVQSGGGYRAG